jgi:16S rRNA (uracil1498-N3)-methyltransferase
VDKRDRVIRRVYVDDLHTGEITLSQDQAHHVRDVIRLVKGEQIEVFDSRGNTGLATVAHIQASSVRVLVHRITPAPTLPQLIIASAIPKGERADWMIEKLSELGVARFIPLATARSVVHPQGTSKFDRWQRLAIESAKQSHRSGIMQIDDLTSLQDLLNRPAVGELAFLNPDASAPLTALHPPLTLLIGPEGGWSNEELEEFAKRHVRSVRLTDTILRIETAAIAAAAIVLTHARTRT